MSGPPSVEDGLGPSRDAIVRLLASTSEDATRDLAELLREILRGPYFKAADAPCFTVMDVDLHAASPTFPGATIVADRVDPLVAARRGAVDVDRAAFLSWPVMRHAGKDHTVASTLDVASSSGDEGRPPPAALRAVIHAIARVVLDALRAMGDPVDKLAPIIMHHTVGDASSVFIPREASLNSLGLDAPLTGGITCGAVMKLVRPRTAGRRVVYEVGDVEHGKLLFSIGTWGEDGIFVLAEIDAQRVLEVSARAEGLFEHYFRLVVVLRAGSEQTRLRVWLDDVLIGSTRSGPSRIERLTGRQSIGAGVLGRHRSGLFLRELLLIGRPLGPTERSRLSRRLSRHVRPPRSDAD
ncbi:MAG: hypothetical protein KC657_36655 [Myxococcales bacterium]|nr:hypothetical protein [Myxococcales bacterium]